MLTIILQASILFIKSSLYSIAYTILIDKKDLHKKALLAILCNFISFFIFSKIEIFAFSPFLNAVVPLLVATIILSLIFGVTLKKSFFYFLILFVVFIKASIYSSYISILLYNETLPLLDISSMKSFLFIIISFVIVYINLIIIKKCTDNYNSLSSKVSFSMAPFLITNSIILFLNFSINYYGYIRLKTHLLLASTDLKLSIVSLFIIIEMLLLALLKLYNVLIRNNIRLTLVKDIADNDALTGVLSREKGLSILKSKILTSKKIGSPLTICFIDINNLKKVNDRFGHEEGDRLIEVVSTTIKDKLRRFDVMCRLGGDEFLVVFDSCSLDDAKNSWIRIEKEINKLNDSNQFKFTISVSIGFAQFDKKIHTTIKSLIKEADDEMYRQKKINKFYEKVNRNNN